MPTFAGYLSRKAVSDFNIQEIFETFCEAMKLTDDYGDSYPQHIERMLLQMIPFLSKEFIFSFFVNLINNQSLSNSKMDYLYWVIPEMVTALDYPVAIAVTIQLQKIAAERATCSTLGFNYNVLLINISLKLALHRNNRELYENEIFAALPELSRSIASLVCQFLFINEKNQHREMQLCVLDDSDDYSKTVGRNP
jgi:hypothetical protein